MGQLLCFKWGIIGPIAIPSLFYLVSATDPEPTQNPRFKEPEKIESAESGVRDYYSNQFELHEEMNDTEDRFGEDIYTGMEE